MIRRLDFKVLFPMHWRKQEHKYQEFAADLRRLGIAQPIICPEKRGDRLFCRNGAVQD